jgi:hypothetical protein
MKIDTRSENFFSIQAKLKMKETKHSGNKSLAQHSESAVITRVRNLLTVTRKHEGKYVLSP